jgi:hypothetical protein
VARASRPRLSGFRNGVEACRRRRRDYFDGCLRDETQLVRSYRYVLRQSVRHGVCRDYRDYPHTRVTRSLEACAAFARERRALMYGVPYARYERHQEHQERRRRRRRS